MVVLRIVDGDTLDVRGDGRVLPKGAVVRVRLLEIDAPERGACFADAATARVTTLLPPGSRLRAERDAEPTDRYDRYLLYVWNEKGTFVNESLVRSGVPDVDCSDLSGPVWVGPADPHRLDREGDGIGCDAN